MVCDKNARSYWESLGASACPDDIVRDMSIREISARLPRLGRVLDLGCGNGYCTYEFAESSGAEFIGVDYSASSVLAANNAMHYHCRELGARIHFEEGTALDLQFGDGSFDAVVTVRCLINVGGFEEQKTALDEISRVLVPGGLYLMCENFLSGLKRINCIRGIFGLEDIQMRWHNKYLDDDSFVPQIMDTFEVVDVVHFASSYYLGSRVVNALWSRFNGCDPQYDSLINKISSYFPPIGDFSPMRLYVLRKM